MNLLPEIWGLISSKLNNLFDEFNLALVCSDSIHTMPKEFKLGLVIKNGTIINHDELFWNHPELYTDRLLKEKKPLGYEYFEGLPPSSLIDFLCAIIKDDCDYLKRFDNMRSCFYYVKEYPSFYGPGDFTNIAWYHTIEGGKVEEFLYANYSYFETVFDGPYRSTESGDDELFSLGNY